MGECREFFRKFGAIRQIRAIRVKKRSSFEDLKIFITYKFTTTLFSGSYIYLTITYLSTTTVGFSMGASWAVLVAANEPDIAAVTMFYGAGEADFKQVKAKVLGHFSDVDEWEPLDGVRAMEVDMKSAGLDVTLHIYPEAGHWFAETDRPEYNADAATLAWARTFEFLKKNL